VAEQLAAAAALEAAPAAAADRHTSPSQTSVHDVSESLQWTTTRSLATGWTHDRAGPATGPQPNTTTGKSYVTDFDPVRNTQ